MSMIPDEAIEAVLIALFPDEIDRALRRSAWTGTIKIILEAAAPHMLAEAWKQGLNTGSGVSVWEANQRPNPYKEAK